MCGIVGYVGPRPVVSFLLKGLKTLEYRGYDSAGVAYFDGASIKVKKSEGKLSRLVELMADVQSDASRCGIGHTRWATHGRPTTQNAHPHRAGHVVLIHNGIIENYREIKEMIIRKGHRPESETDSELFGYLVLEEMDGGATLEEAVRKSFLQIEGSCSFVVMSEKNPGKVVGICRGAPLVAAIDPKGGGVLASDAQPLLDFTQDVYFLHSGDQVVLTDQGISFFDAKTGKLRDREATHLDWSPEKADKKGYAHYMLKEIYEQPTVIVDTLNGVLDRSRTEPFSFTQQPGVDLLRNAKSLCIVACGTSYYTAMLGKYWLEKWARIPVEVELSSEFRYRDPVLQPGTVVVGISQSGETADTLAVIQEMKKFNVPTIAVTNVRGSTISRDATATFFTSAGPEISVLATKTFTANNIMLLLWAGCLGYQRAIENKDRKTQQELTDIFQQLVRLPHLFEAALNPGGEATNAIKTAAKKLQNKRGFFFIGRGYSYPLSLEGALKLKEVAYLHAEGYAAGELKHGPIAMIDKDMVVVVLAPEDRWREKTVSNLNEVKARGAIVVGVGNARDESTRALCDEWVSIPTELDQTLNPFLLTPVIQLLSYEIALLKGTSVDQPRNLAKSVTVE